MYRILLFILAIAATPYLNAQNKCSTITTDNDERTTCYFGNGRKSTETITKKSESYWHKFLAYDMSGKVIYEREYGRKWGSSGVEVKYHPNGAMASARYTMQPDGGIQHTDITSYFSTEGKFEREEDNSIGNDGQMHISPIYDPIQRPAVVKPQTTPKPAQAPNECAPVPNACDLYVINFTSETIRLKAQYKKINASPFDKVIEPSDTVKVGVYYPYHPAESPLNHYALTVPNKAREGYEYRLSHVQSSDAKKQYMIISLTRKGLRQK